MHCWSVNVVGSVAVCVVVPCCVCCLLCLLYLFLLLVTACDAVSVPVFFVAVAVVIVGCSGSPSHEPTPVGAAVGVSDTTLIVVIAVCDVVAGGGVCGAADGVGGIVAGVCFVATAADGGVGGSTVGVAVAGADDGIGVVVVVANPGGGDGGDCDCCVSACCSCISSKSKSMCSVVGVVSGLLLAICV